MVNRKTQLGSLLAQKNLVDDKIMVRMKCKDQEEQLARLEGDLKSTKRKTLSKVTNFAKISKRMHATKEEGSAFDNAIIRVTSRQKFDGVHRFEGESEFWRKTW